MTLLCVTACGDSPSEPRFAYDAAPRPDGEGPGYRPPRCGGGGSGLGGSGGGSGLGGSGGSGLDCPDAGPGADGSLEDAGPPPPPPPPCNEHTFRYRGTASSVLVTGTFTSWAPTEAEGALPLERVAGTGDQWELTTLVEPPGRHLYKFVVDGTFVQDTGNPEAEADGFGGFNSVLSLCGGGSLTVEEHATDSASGTFTARVRAMSSPEPASVAVTVDWRDAPGAVTVSGDVVSISVAGLADGIHDVRLTVGDETLLLKVYVNETTDWRDVTLYFAMTDRFVNGDPGNDAPVGGIENPLANYMGGDFAGITSKIEDGYFDELGVSAIWVSWPADNPGDAWPGFVPTGTGCGQSGGPGTSRRMTTFSGYHGYWPSSGTDIEEHFGTLEELRALVVAAHARGIRILLDFAVNHVHQAHPYYAEHRDDWFNQPADVCEVVGWDTKPEQCWFTEYLPDWDYRVPEARNRVLDDAVSLVVSTGADGFRVDALKHMDMQFVRDLRSRMRGAFEQTGVPFYMVGETFTGDTGLIRRYVGDDLVHGQFDFPSNLALLDALAFDRIGVDELHRRVRGHADAYGSGALMSTFLGNHDMARFVSNAAGDLDCGGWDIISDIAQGWRDPPPRPTQPAAYARLRMAFTYLFALPGIPLVYYGDEIGLPGAGDPDNRRMLYLEGLTGNEQETLDWVRALGRAREQSEALRRGDLGDALVADASTLAFARRAGSSLALAVFNRQSGARSVSVPVGALGLSDGTALRSATGGTSRTVTGGRVDVMLGGYGAEILTTD
ncbi:MAG: hypothetical protein IT379_04335 [Deltaproteobacteria bacterium]|nr:hypothetical protein [Deltaproteobacteria bacterium]